MVHTEVNTEFNRKTWSGAVLNRTNAQKYLLKFSNYKRVFSYVLNNRVVLYCTRLSGPKTSYSCVGKLIDQMDVVRGPYAWKSD